MEGDPCIDDVKRAISRASDPLGIRYALVFDSLARRGCGRDVDLVVKLDWRPRSLLDIGRLQVILEDIIGSRVDLIVIDLGVPPGLAKVIVDEAVLVWGAEDEARRDLARLYMEYLDYSERLRMTGLHSRRPPPGDHPGPEQGG